MRVRVAAILLTVCLLHGQSSGAQSRAPSDGGFTKSLGQPDQWKWSAGLAVGRTKGEAKELLSATEMRLGAYHDLMNPVIGVAGLNFEGYLGTRGTQLDGGMRAHIASPVLRLGLGVDYNLKTGRARTDISYYHPIIRGGLFRNGSTVRVDLMPGRNWYFMAGFDTPIHRQIPTGQTRPRSDRVKLTPARPVTAPAPTETQVGVLRAAMADAGLAATRIRQLNIPFLDHPAADRKKDEVQAVARIRRLQRELATAPQDGVAPFRTMSEEVNHLHAAVARAYSLALNTNAAATTAEGEVVASRARQVLLAEVLLPYNRMLGQIKKHDSTKEFATRARGVFMRWLHTESKVPPASREAVLWVFTTLLEIVEENRRALRAEWGDSRFVWLPLQYALTPDQHDSQGEVDALIEQAANDQFTEGNFVSFIINEQFQYHLRRTIKAAKRYHVLWVHDFRGYDTKGDPDRMSYNHVLHSYLSALTTHVREYDSTGTFPVYMILLDQIWYQVNRSSLWMNLLEDPTRYRVRLPKGNSAWEDSLVVAQDSLRAAIARSSLLRSQRGQFGEHWLRNMIRVHVNITNVADQSFWSWTLIPGVATPDNMMRDHRKIAFYDLTEEDPYVGEALYTGAGVGEHYSNLSWEDRALLVQGPAVLGMKAAARDALMNQGIRLRDIPSPLQPLPKAPDYAARIRKVDARGQTAIRALGLHNETGFDDKDINVAKAILYTLMPSGSVIKIPDSLWNSPFWGSALIGAALRGVRVLVIAPSFANAPARSFGSMVRSAELLWRLVTASQLLAPNIAHVGGLLKVGIFSTEVEVNDIAGKVQAVRTTFEQHQWLQALFGFPRAVYTDIASLADSLKRVPRPPRAPEEFESTPHPKLHLKANYFASQEAWQIITRSEWPVVYRDFVKQRFAQSENRTAAIARGDDVADAILNVGTKMADQWYADLSKRDRDRVVFYTMMGSQNQNARSMITDGEDALIMSHWLPVIPYLDVIELVGQSRWIQNAEELYTLIPPQSTLRRRLAHWAKLAF